MIGTTGHQIDPRGVNHAAHYNKHPSGIEAIVVMRHMSLNLGMAFKYVYRRGEKPEVGLTLKEAVLKDLDKAIWYLRDETKTLAARAPSHPVEADELWSALDLVIEHEPDPLVREIYEEFRRMFEYLGTSDHTPSVHGILQATQLLRNDLADGV